MILHLNDFFKFAFNFLKYLFLLNYFFTIKIFKYKYKNKQKRKQLFWFRHLFT